MMTARIVLLAVVAILAVAADSKTVLYTAAPVHPKWSLVEDKVNMEQYVDISIGLKRRNWDQLTKIFWDSSIPTSATYGDHLNSDTVRALTAPASADINVVVQWLKQSGIVQYKLSNHHDYIQIRPTLAQVEVLLNVTFANYKHMTSHRVVARALGEVKIPMSIATIVEVISGIRGFPLVRARIQRVGAKSPETHVTPEHLIQTYTLSFPGAPTNGKKNIQSFFQAQAEYVDGSDLTQFCTQYGVKDCKIDRYVGPNQPSNPGLESSLDSEYITTTGRGVETWVFSYSNNDFCGDLIRWGTDVFALGKIYPWVISMSYGSQEYPCYCSDTDAARLSEDVKKMGAMGITVVIASGDDGSGEYNRQSGYNNGFLANSFPSSIPYAVSVGATTFVHGNSGEEMASDAFGSGGGFAWTYNAEDYQKDAIAKFFKSGSLPPQKMYNSTGRGTPDVTLLGEGYSIISDGSSMEVDGTSCSTPTFAGMVSLLNNIRLQSNKTLGFLNPLLYAHPEGFTDIVKGTNAISPSTIGWNAVPGWDPASGLGTPKFNVLLDIVKKLNERERK